MYKQKKQLVSIKNDIKIFSSLDILEGLKFE